MRPVTTQHISAALKSLLIVFILLFGTLQIFSQNILKGRITDPQGNAIHGASVFCTELHRGTTTDDHGSFILPSLQLQKLTIECSHVGYHSLIRSISFTKQNEVTIVLHPINKSLEEIQVNISNDLNKNSTYTTTTVTTSELQNSGQNTMMETLSTKAGIDIISTGGIGKPVIRGLSFNRIALFSMGTKIESQQWDDDHDAGIADAGIERAEIIYGPSALTYGADALGGAIIFVDERNAPVNKTMGNVSLALFSNTKGINTSGSIKHTFASGIYINAFLNNQSHCDYLPGAPVKAVTKMYALNSRYQNLSAKAKVGINEKWGGTKLSYSFLRSASGIVADQEDDSVAQANGKPYFSNDRKMIGHYFDVTTQVLSSENTFNTSMSKWNFDISYQQNNRKEFMPEAPAGPENLTLGLLLNTLNCNVKWSTETSKNFGISFGMQGMFQNNKNYGKIIATPDAVISNFGLYGLAHYNTGNWNFQGGVRIDHRNLRVEKTSGSYEDETSLDSMERSALDSLGLKRRVSNFEKEYVPFNLSAGVVYHPLENLTLKCNVASGYSAPNFGELSTYWKHEGTYKFEIGNQDLQPQHNIEGDINMVWLLKNLSVTASAFFNHIHNYIYLAPTKDSAFDLQIVEFTQRNAAITGGELSIALHPAHLKWVEFNTALSVSAGKISDGTFLPYFPSNKLTGELKFEADSLDKLKNPYFSFSASHHFAQNKPALYETPTKAYSLLDINFGSDVKFLRQRLHVVLFCTNVFNTAYYNHLSLLKVIGVYDRGRNIGIRLSLPLGN